MIHKIKAMYDNGNGQSVRQIAKILGISRNTVRKYLSTETSEIAKEWEDKSRDKLLDAYRDHIINMLRNFPNLSAVKVLRRLEGDYGPLSISSRTVRRYLEALRESVNEKQLRYYQPVVDTAPGLQCQVDGGEMRGVLIGGEKRTVYFVVFVLSFSRKMYVALSMKPVDTTRFIQMHDEAFRYFGGMPRECVYDQTRLVVIHEQFRELELNERFYQYATLTGFSVRACVGYDPESKGKVEAGVKYVKQNALYGEVFSDFNALQLYMSNWLDTVANQRVHGTTGMQPEARYQNDEAANMRPYHTPPMIYPSGPDIAARKVDKTGLIAWRSNKYSVPMAWQCGNVGVLEEGSLLKIIDLESGDELACHTLHAGKGQVIKNKHHYRNPEEVAANLEQAIIDLIGAAYGKRLCELLKQSSPKIYKDQLRGMKQILSQNQDLLTETVLSKLCEKSLLTASKAAQWLDAWRRQQEKIRGFEQSQYEHQKEITQDVLANYASLPIHGGGYVKH